MNRVVRIVARSSFPEDPTGLVEIPSIIVIIIHL